MRQPFFPTAMTYIKRELSADMEKVLDVGCGLNSPLGEISGSHHMTGVDMVKPLNDFYDVSRQGNIKRMHLFFKMNSFDAVIALDVIEHLKKIDGLLLIADMEWACRGKVIIFTPNGFLPQAGTKENPYQEHLSGWTVAEFRRYGYRVIGINGWKPLRHKCAELRWKPALFWHGVSWLTDLYTRHHPEHAFQLLAIKEM